MANKQYTVSNTDRGDNSSFTVPGDEDGGVGDSSFQTDESGLNAAQKWYVHIDNGWDVDVDITPQGSHYKDESMSNAGADGSAFTVSSGTVDFVDGETAHSFLEMSVNPAGTPTSGNLVVTFQSREWS